MHRRQGPAAASAANSRRHAARAAHDAPPLTLHTTNHDIRLRPRSGAAPWWVTFTKLRGLIFALPLVA